MIKILPKPLMLGTLLLCSSSVANHAETKKEQPLSNNNVEIAKTPTQTVATNPNTYVLQVGKNSSVPTSHNPKLDATLRKTATNAKEQSSIDQITKNVYNVYGLYAASAHLQHESDRRMFFHFLNGNTAVLRDNNLSPVLADAIDEHKMDFDKSVSPYANHLYNWVVKEYSPEFRNNMPEGKPTYDEMKEYIDQSVYNSNLPKKSKILYNMSVRNYERNLPNPNSEQDKSNAVAHRVHVMDNLVFQQKIEEEHVGAGYYSNNPLSVESWLKTVAP